MKVNFISNNFSVKSKQNNDNNLNTHKSLAQNPLNNKAQDVFVKSSNVITFTGFLGSSQPKTAFEMLNKLDISQRLNKFGSIYQKAESIKDIESLKDLFKRISMLHPDEMNDGYNLVSTSKAYMPSSQEKLELFKTLIGKNSFTPAIPYNKEAKIIDTLLESSDKEFLEEAIPQYVDYKRNLPAEKVKKYLDKLISIDTEKKNTSIIELANIYKNRIPEKEQELISLAESSYVKLLEEYANADKSSMKALAGFFFQPNLFSKEKLTYYSNKFADAGIIPEKMLSYAIANRNSKGGMQLVEKCINKDFNQYSYRQLFTNESLHSGYVNHVYATTRETIIDLLEKLSPEKREILVKSNALIEFEVPVGEFSQKYLTK
ncbi:MAG: hypothetical protein WCY19_04920 [Candidatus Gastranaerophilaceae bacterium]